MKRILAALLASIITIACSGTIAFDGIKDNSKSDVNISAPIMFSSGGRDATIDPDPF